MRPPQTWARKRHNTHVSAGPGAGREHAGTYVLLSAHPETRRRGDRDTERARNGRKETEGEGHPEMPSVPPPGIGGRALVRGLVPPGLRAGQGGGGRPGQAGGLPSAPPPPPGRRKPSSRGDTPSQGRPRAGQLRWLLAGRRPFCAARAGGGGRRAAAQPRAP